MHRTFRIWTILVAVLACSAGAAAQDRPLDAQQGAAKMAELISQAQQLDIKIKHAPSLNPTVLELYPENASQVQAFGLHIHGGMPSEKLERILRESLRAIAFSNAIRGNDLEVPTLSPAREIVLLHENDRFDLALAEAIKNRGLSQGQADDLVLMDSQSFVDRRGWRTSRWMTEAGYQALVIWDTNELWLSKDTQPCLLAGHLNWLSMNFFGTSMPVLTWRTNDENRHVTIAGVQVREGALWRSAKSSTFACRTWMKARMQAGDSFPYTFAIVDELGEVRNESLLKATFVNEYLQCSGELGKLIGATSLKPRTAKTISMGLGRSLAEFEREWANWFLYEDNQLLLLQAAAGKKEIDKNEESEDEAMAALRFLREIRKQAYSNANIWAEEVNLYPDLSLQAQLHAQYLKFNPKQAKKWPGAHEEYSNRKGFTPAGAWAARHSMIHFSPDPIVAMEEWMATFYHRLSMLEPGLFGIGFGSEGKFCVLDTSSLIAPYWGEEWVVWPPQDASNVQRNYQPELPNPVPGSNLKSMGYPITLQAYWGAKPGSHSIQMTLYKGKSESSNAVPCYSITPDAPLSKVLAPENAYCLIPKAVLKSNQTYTVVAECDALQKKLVWNFKTDSK
ncbi:MAG: hypothetical protein HQ519_04815 [Planctomycetes bacterium]|nr:hypothetical protein [Planctomycetota bacterium]